MTNFKKTTTSFLTAALLGSAMSMGIAHAQDAPSPFASLDVDANGQVNFSEYAKDAEMRGQSIEAAMRQFNVISGGEQTFNQSQYAASFAVQGEINTQQGGNTVIMPVEPSAVMGEVATGIVVEEPVDVEEPAADLSDDGWDDSASESLDEWSDEAAENTEEWTEDAADTAEEWTDEATDTADEWADEVTDEAEEWNENLRENTEELSDDLDSDIDAETTIETDTDIEVETEMTPEKVETE
ncbi:clathrin light subunit [Litorimonas taeanensis]|uniref:Clathrin light subunit n=1 Tax=Litorimonas taeanensis TaxID=568099 RepID=A0A420WF44_9PROT|nr:hypothetical protein [Litorimonas taeanensis]RKQ69606.1 clathrin light subunit [Litorimonas taeanensis]